MHPASRGIERRLVVLGALLVFSVFHFPAVAQTPTVIDDFTEYTYSVPAGPVGSFADRQVTRTFAQPIASLRLFIVGGSADDIGYVGGRLVTNIPGMCQGVGTVNSVQEVTDQVTISGNTATFLLRAQENCCCTTGWGSATQGDRANARFHWIVTLGSPSCVPTAAAEVDPQILSSTTLSTQIGEPRMAAGPADVARASELAAALAAVEPYVDRDENRFQHLRTADARRAGVPGEAIAVAMRVIALDNRVVAAAQRGEEPDLGPADFEFIEPLFLQIAQTDPCGTHQNPAPCPSRVESNVFFFTHADVVQHLEGLGYHRTSNYAGGRTGNDYSRVVAHACGGSTFREQAIIHQRSQCWTYNTQGPEPNPEVLEYGWPRLGWAGYVRWWHLRFC